MITVLAGGVGAARLLRGMVQAGPAHEVPAIVNTPDDRVLHGLSVSPDLDTVTYTLAEVVNPDTGWGLADETW
ncbi:MAG: 2-phospho-L-lactate transferase CofD family protein, partial [Actinomycetota bacterium]|nr:2-phospho-L-lactate transferase CofD family protein [Actinomycetota bacterium]